MLEIVERVAIGHETKKNIRYLTHFLSAAGTIGGYTQIPTFIDPRLQPCREYGQASKPT
jgi:hypothetical protein